MARRSHGQYSSAAPAGSGQVWRSVINGVVTVARIGLLALAIALAVVPRVLGGQAMTVLTGSMEPTYRPGDIIVAVPQDSYSIGDAVTFQPKPDNPTLVTHRIVAIRTGGNDTRYVTRGDANGADDEPIKAEQVMGKVTYSVPYIGHVTGFIGGHRNAAVAIVAVILIGYGVVMVGSDAANKRRRKKAKAS